MRILMSLFVAVLSVGLFSGVANAGAKKPFTATTVQTMPNVGEQRGKIFVANDGIRFEFQDNGRDVVQMIMTEKRMMRLLFPADKTFIESKSPAETPVMNQDNPTPCPPSPALTCTKINDEKFGDIHVERWHVVIKGNPAISTLWWDPKRKMTVRQEYPDGRVMQMNMTGTEDFYGRRTERWDISYANPNGQITNAMRLVDLDLGIIVMERSASGVTRELRDLKVVKRDAKWFDVPKDYQRIEQPQLNAPQPAVPQAKQPAQ